MGVVSLSLSACGDGVFGFCLLFLGLLSELRPLESEHESCRLSLWGLPAPWLRAGLSEARCVSPREAVPGLAPEDTRLAEKFRGPRAPWKSSYVSWVLGFLSLRIWIPDCCAESVLSQPVEMRPWRPAPSRWVFAWFRSRVYFRVAGLALQSLAGGPRSWLQAKGNFGNSTTRGQGPKARANFLQAGLTPPFSLLVNL